MRRFARATLVACCALSLLCAGFGGSQLAAQEKEKKVSKGQPFLVVSVASFERLLDDADYMFSLAGRPELSEMIGGALANVRDLKGLNRDSSVGFMLFLEGLIPEPIGFVPTKDIDEMMKTITIGPVTTNKKEDGLYEIRGPAQSVFAKVVGDYAFIGRSEEALERDFSDPAQYTRRLSASYDIGASFNLRAIPKTSRDLMLDFLRANTEAKVQQRDDEPDAAFKIRRAAEMSNLAGLEMFLQQAEEATLGFNVSSQDKTAFIEMVVTADPKSEYAGLLNELGAARSHFTSLLKNPTAMTASTSMKIDKNGRKFLKEIVSVAEEQLIGAIAKQDGKSSPISELFQSIQTSVDDGRMDAIAQFLGDPPGPFTFAGGIKISEAEKFSTGLIEIIEKLKGRSEFESVQTKVVEHRGVTLNRIQGKNAPEAANRIFGENAGLYIGAGKGVVWFAIGGDEGLPALKKMIDTVTDAPVDDSPVSPMQFVLHLSSWLGLMERPDGTAGPGVELMRESFAGGGGTIRAEIRPLQDGMQFRLSFDEGYIRLVGKSIARNIDRNR